MINHIQNKSFCLHNICVCTVYISGMWSARDKTEGKSDHAPSHAHKPLPQVTPTSHSHKPRPQHLFKKIYFSPLKDISYTVRIQYIVL